VAAEASARGAAVFGSAVVVPGEAEHPTISATEAATARALAFRLAPAIKADARGRLSKLDKIPPIKEGPGE
jgi:hypothetical protein